jgi:hypothetical protein
MSDISLTVGDGARRMTYAELAEARGTSPATDAMSDTARAIRALESAVEGLREQLEHERARADRECGRADQIEQQLTKVEGELIAARVEAAGLRCQLEQARPKPATPDPPRTRWSVPWLLRALGHTR